MNTKILSAMGAVIAIGLSAYFFTQKPSAPIINIQTLDNQSINFSQTNKTYFVNFWATNCPGCIKEMPDLVKAYHELKQKNANVEFIAIAMSYDKLEYIENFVQQNKLPFKIVYDKEGKYAQAFGGVQVTPTSFIINPQGKITYKTIGEITHDQLIQKLML